MNIAFHWQLIMINLNIKNMKQIAYNLEILSSVLKHNGDIKNKKAQEVIERFSKNDFPTSKDTLNLIREVLPNPEIVMEKHPGIKTEKAISSVKNCLIRFDICASNLFEKIDAYEQETSDKYFYHVDNKDIKQALHDEINVNIINTLNAAKTLIDMSIKLQRKIHTAGYKDKLDEFLMKKVTL